MCDYPDVEFMSGVKFFCRGEDFTCKDILSTKVLTLNEKFRLTNTNRGFDVSIRDVSSQDAGVYWCGVESNGGSYKASIRQIKLVIEEPSTASPTFTQSAVVPHVSSEPSTASPTFTQSAAVPHVSSGVFELVITVMKCITVLVLLGVSILIFKRLCVQGDTGAPPAARRCSKLNLCHSQHSHRCCCLTTLC
ncbi:CMRF35-like molecule 1 [Oreochromis aureus]|uniref:CMRF35-like molecule 1 n=1 Tax=Oreochromis aureus TaxID=47969 RepID=UPI0019540BD1|nr:CMRF35-like molecule 1 [Oreochromis aureus]